MKLALPPELHPGDKTNIYIIIDSIKIIDCSSVKTTYCNKSTICNDNAITYFIYIINIWVMGTQTFAVIGSTQRHLYFRKEIVVKVEQLIVCR